jgi:hypothetical protein
MPPVGGAKIGDRVIQSIGITGPWFFHENEPDFSSNGTTTLTPVVLDRAYTFSHWEISRGSNPGVIQQYLLMSIHGLDVHTHDDMIVEGVFKKDFKVDIGTTGGGYVYVHDARFGDADEGWESNFGDYDNGISPRHGFLRYAFQDRTTTAAHGAGITKIDLTAMECDATIQRFVVFQWDGEDEDTLDLYFDVVPTRNILTGKPNPVEITIDRNLVIVAEFN